MAKRAPSTKRTKPEPKLPFNTDARLTYEEIAIIMDKLAPLPASSFSAIHFAKWMRVKYNINVTPEAVTRMHRAITKPELSFEQVVKTAVFAAAYGGNAFAISKKLGFDISQDMLNKIKNYMPQPPVSDVVAALPLDFRKQPFDVLLGVIERKLNRGVGPATLQKAIETAPPEDRTLIRVSVEGHECWMDVKNIGKVDLSDVFVLTPSGWRPAKAVLR